MYHILIILLLIGPATTTKDGSTPKSYLAVINESEVTIKAEVLYEKEQVKTDLRKTYAWFSSNKIHETKGGYSGRLLHGKYTSFYLSGSLKESGCFQKGLKHGIWITWFSTGKIMEITEWKKGFKSGKQTLYHPSGAISVESEFKADKLHGKMKSYPDEKTLIVRKYRHGKEVIKKMKKKIPKSETKVKRKSFEIKKPWVKKSKSNEK